jgi:4-hydroxy-tetrahydrodipicolinate synthase
MANVDHPSAWLAGYIPDLPTPFDQNDKIDLASFERLCERQIDAGTTALVVGETTGESSTLTTAEHDLIVRAAVKTSRGRVRIIAGAGSNSTSQAIALTRRAEADGADAILSVVPYYNKPMQAGIYAHFRAIAESTALPIVLHDVPSRTVRELSDDTVVRLAELQQFIGIKDATGDVTRPLRLKPLVRQDFRLLSGDDASAAAFLFYGGDGCISVTSNVAPALCNQIYLTAKGGSLQATRRAAIELTELTTVLSLESIPAALKYALSLLGLMLPDVRLPIVELSDSSKARTATAIAKICFEDSALSLYR